jgi:DNA-directed RNA polymerase alpha subunit
MTISISIDHLSDDELYRIYVCLKGRFDQAEMNSVFDMDLQDRFIRIEMSIRVIHILKAIRINTVKDLCARKRSALLKIKGMGPRSLEEIERLLRSYGLELAGE